MKTDELVALLARDVAPVPADAGRRRLAVALAASLPLSLAIMLAGYGVRHDLGSVAAQPMLWVKFAVPLAVAAAGALALRRLGSPGVAAGRAWLPAVAAVLALWLLAVLQWQGLPATARAPALWGSTWRTCVFNIGLIGLPVLAGALWALRGLATTQPARAGAAAGLLAGGAGAAVYALHCPEVTAPFLAVWYVLGMALPAVAGAWLGPRLLRW